MLKARFLFVFALLSSLMGISVGLAKVVTSLYALHLGASDALVGGIAAAQSVGVLIMSLPLGFMVERHGPSRLFALGSLVASALYFVTPLVRSGSFLLVCTLSLGFCMPFRFVSLNTVFLGQLATLGHHKAGWYRGTHVAGTFLIGPLLAASCIEGLGFAGTYVLIGAAFLLTVLLAPLVFRHHTTSADPLRRGTPLRAQVALFASDRELQNVCLVELTVQAINIYYSVFILVIAVNELGLGAAVASGLVAAQGLTFVVALIALGGFARWLGDSGVYATGTLCAICALLLLGTSSSATWLWVGGTVLGSALGLLQIVNLMRFAQIGERLGRGRIAGLNALVGPLGGLLGSLVGSLLGSRLGLQAVFLAFLPLLALMYFALSGRDRATDGAVG